MLKNEFLFPVIALTNNFKKIHETRLINLLILILFIIATGKKIIFRWDE
jgi:hypothetical protein